MTSPGTSTHTNRLAEATSPYLLQHKNNPVDWWQWGPDALAEAKRSNRPILLSVGYAACHWCHVMAHESFEDDATARVMNELFVSIKVDREERPDIDQIYMNALHLLGEQGGWPLTMFLTPQGEPVWGGTYFPKDSKFGRPAFKDVLREVSRLFREEPEKIEKNRAALLARLADRARPAGKVVIGIKELDSAAQQVGNMFDPVNGGFRGAPKFPQPMMLEMLWRAGLRTGDRRFFEIVELSLDRMSEGGIYDHLGGGFSRYSVDERWLVPHFEKMLYDNAQLLELLALAYARTGTPLYKQRAKETVAWLKREMVTGEGAFSASLDADSEGEEGKFYVWSKAEIVALLGADDGRLFTHQYDVSDSGNFEGHNILNRLTRRERSEADEARLAPMREKLLVEREKRVRPGLDDKALADWNGLMIAALVNAGGMLGEPEWVELARRAFEFVARMMTKVDALGHSWRRWQLLMPGLASDYAAMIRAALALYEATGTRVYLDQAVTWQHSFDRHYANSSNGGYYLTSDEATDLLLRPHATSDDATPNANSLAAQNLVRLALFTGEEKWRAKADALIEGVLSAAGDNLFAHVALLNALDLRLRAAEIVVTGREANRFAAAALKLPFVDRIVLRAPNAESLPASHPAQAKLASGLETAAFVCVGETCSLPVGNANDIADVVAGMRKSS
ncbi:MAG: thioredoxin domain-containing protein [Pseudolabrys sp.]